MQIEIYRFFKLLLFTSLAGLSSFCAISKATLEWKRSNILAVISDSHIFSQFFDVKPWFHHLSLILIAIFIGLSASKSLSSYPKRLFNSFILMGASWHHYLCAALMGSTLGIVFFAFNFKTYDKWYFFNGDGLLVLVACFFYCASQRPVTPIVRSVTFLPDDIIGVSSIIDYILRRIGSSFESQKGPLPKTLAIAGERGSGKSYILEKVRQKLVSEMDLQCEIFKPWNFDSHTLFYEEVMKHLFRLLEDKYVIPKPKALVNNYISSFSDDPKKIFSTFFGQFFGDFSSEKRTLQDAEMWISNIGNIVLVFDDLDRCHQSELRHVFRLMDRLSVFPNIFVVASIDSKTVDKIGKFENRIEIPVRIAS